MDALQTIDFDSRPISFRVDIGCVGIKLSLFDRIGPRGHPVEEDGPARSFFQVVLADPKRVIRTEIGHYRFPIHSYFAN